MYLLHSAICILLLWICLSRYTAISEVYNNETCPVNCTCKSRTSNGFIDVSCRRLSIPRTFPLFSKSITLYGVRQSTIFPETFRNLSYLKNLTILNSDINTLMNMSFTGLDNLESIILKGCQVHKLQPLVFTHFKGIIHIDLSFNKFISFLKLENAFDHLQNISKLQTLILRNVNNRRSTTFLKNTFWKSIKYSGIKTLCLSDNELCFIEGGFAKYLTFLENLTLSNNALFGSYQAFDELFTLKSLRYLDMSNQNLQNQMTRPIRSLESEISYAVNLTGQQCKVYPQHLQTILFGNFRTLQLHFEPWNICPNNSVKHYDLSSIIASEINNIWGLEKLEYFDFTNNDCSKILNPAFFGNFPKLITLLLGNNKLGHYVTKDVSGSLFKTNKFLKNLDFSDNGIDLLPELFLKSVENITHFNLGGNKLSNLNHIHLMKNLSVLNVSKNIIGAFTSSLQSFFDDRGGYITINISHNPLTTSQDCCNTREFIYWMRRTKVNLDGVATFMCTHHNNKKTMSKLTDTFFINECSSNQHTVFNITIPTLVVLMSITAICAVCYRKRWTLIWMVTILNRFTKTKVRFQTTDDVIFDAFISYSGDDLRWVRDHLEVQLEVKRHYRLCIHERDFIPGYPIDENIVESISLSRHTVILLTKSFQESDWCDFELTTAYWHSKNTEEYRIIPILLESFDFSKASSLLKSILEEHTYIEWSDNNRYRGVFWEALLRGLGDPLAL